jgi:hypothetical protein
LAFEIPRIDAKALKHADQRLAGKGGAAQLIAGAIQPNDKAVTHQLIVAYTLNIHYILNSDLG